MDKIITKEEILKGNFISLTKDVGMGRIKNIRKAMDEYAEIQSIAFVEWASGHQWQFLSWGGDKGKGWHQGTTYSVPPITTEQLYKIFIEQQVK